MKTRLAKQKLQHFKEMLDKELEITLEKEIIHAQTFSPQAVEYMQHLRHLALDGGKRLRAGFVYYTYLMFGGQNISAILQTAMGIELLHLYLLIEDDVMDLAENRHNYPTLHEIYKKYHLEKGYKHDSTHFGLSVAINIGLITSHIASNLINNAPFAAELNRKVVEKVNTQCIITGHGQIHDILNGVRLPKNEKEVLDVLYWKTGTYTYDNPIQVGAILAQATEEDLKTVSDYAIPAGVAFQIQDDILGVFGDASKTGKPADDLREGKQTLLTFKAYEKANSVQKKLLDRVVGNPNASDGEVEQVKEIIIETGALKYAKERSSEMVNRSKQTLNDGYKDYWVKEGFDFLDGIADYMIEREI